MRKATILFADNDLDFLAARAEYLELKGYAVITATDPNQARSRLEREAIDVAILDIRLWNDDDEKDVSGLTLAQEVARAVPKIILTGFPSYEYVREALRPHLAALPAAVDFVSKPEGPEALLTAVVVALTSPSATRTLERGCDVFVVHGHDDAAKEAVARFIERLGLTAIILHEQPSGGKTLIEKLEEHTNVGFAAVLLTPDDIGGPRNRPRQRRPRARQNVVFELGLLIGKLGRHRVCALCAEDIEIPSDLAGVVYLPMDSGGGWKLPLAQEIKRAGIPVDLNRAI